MNPIPHIQNSFAIFLKKQFSIADEVAHQCTFAFNVDPNRQQFGDLNSNAAMALAKAVGKNPREIAQEIISHFKNPLIAKLEIAGPGFINAWLTPQALHDLAKELSTAAQKFFKLEEDVQKYRYNIEFISANPTGPLHLGHGRGGILGDVLGNILSFLGHTVTKEFYINDAGNQIKKLGESFKVRCLQALGMQAELPEDGYRGDYLIPMAQACVTEYGKKLLEFPEDFFCDYAKNKLLEQQKQTLKEYGISFDVWFSEKTLHEDGAIQRAVALLQEKKLIYQHEDALWFSSTQFGDDKDRVVKKSDGPWTYVAADIAYLRNKISRGFDHLVMVLGHDHHSYAVRLQNILKALGDRVSLEVILYQLVTMKVSGQLMQMSKRAGTMVTLNDVIEEVGKDVARFFYLHRKADAQLEFDLDLALKKTEENPVYYIQYAYVRTGSLLEKAEAEKELANITVADLEHVGNAESLLIKKIASLKQLLESISTHHQTHQLTYYTIELADLFHRYYALHKVIDTTNIAQSRGRLALIMLLRNTFALTFNLLGINKPHKM